MGWGAGGNKEENGEPQTLKKKSIESFSPLCEVLGAKTTPGELQSP